MCKYLSKIWRIIGTVSIILGIIGKKKKRNSRKHNWKILEHNRLKPTPMMQALSCCGWQKARLVTKQR